MLALFRILPCSAKRVTSNFVGGARRNLSTYVKPVSTGRSSKEKYSDLLTNFGFNPGQINRILNSSYCILHVKEKVLLSNLVNWLNFNVGNKLFTALSAYPELLTLNPDYVNNQVNELMRLFTKSDINKLLVTCPNVFLNDFENTYDKVEYIVTRMEVEQKSIVKSQALRFDLKHIKSRHTFMTLTGFFKLSKKSTKSRNAPLHKLFSPNMETFLKLTNVTEEEYVVFSNCFSDEIDLDYLQDSEDIDEE